MTTALEDDFIAKLNLAELTPLSPEVIQRQATINIGTFSDLNNNLS